MNLLNLSGSNYQDCTEKFVRYYHLIRNELFELEKERVTDILEMYYVRTTIIMEITNKI